MRYILQEGPPCAQRDKMLPLLEELALYIWGEYPKRTKFWRKTTKD